MSRNSTCAISSSISLLASTDTAADSTGSRAKALHQFFGARSATICRYGGRRAACECAELQPTPDVDPARNVLPRLAEIAHSSGETGRSRNSRLVRAGLALFKG